MTSYSSKIVSMQGYWPRWLSVMLGVCFSAMLSHGHMPIDMIVTTIVPVVKSKVGDISDMNNYRPIALATLASKFLEMSFLACQRTISTLVKISLVLRRTWARIIASLY